MQPVFSPGVVPEALLPEVLSTAAAAGYSHIELFRDRTQSTPVHDDWSVPMVRDAIAQAGLMLAAFTIRDLTGRKADSDEHNLAYNLRQLTWDLHLGRALGVTRMITCGGARTDEARDDLVEGVAKLLEDVGDITLSIGNRAGSPIEGLSDFEIVMPQLPERASVQLDTRQLLTAGESVLPCADALADRLGVVRLSDWKDGGARVLGEGDLPLNDLLALLKERGFDGPLVVELPSVDTDAVGAAAAALDRVTRGM